MLCVTSVYIVGSRDVSRDRFLSLLHIPRLSASLQQISQDYVLCTSDPVEEKNPAQICIRMHTSSCSTIHVVRDVCWGTYYFFSWNPKIRTPVTARHYYVSHRLDQYLIYFGTMYNIYEWTRQKACTSCSTSMAKRKVRYTGRSCIRRHSWWKNMLFEAVATAEICTAKYISYFKTFSLPFYIN